MFYKRALFVFFIVAFLPAANAENEITQEMLNAAQIELQYLSMGNAQRALDEYVKDKSFRPYAAALATTGKTQTFSPSKNGSKENVETGVGVVALKMGLRKIISTGAIICTAVYAPAAIQNKDGLKTMGMVVELEHRLGVGMTRFFPVSIENGKARIGQPVDKIVGLDLFSSMTLEERLGKLASGQPANSMSVKK